MEVGRALFPMSLLVCIESIASGYFYTQVSYPIFASAQQDREGGTGSRRERVGWESRVQTCHLILVRIPLRISASLVKSPVWVRGLNYQQERQGANWKAGNPEG